jgi:ankyrin repeat protein
MNDLKAMLAREQRLPSVFLRAIDSDDIRTVRVMINLGQNVEETNSNLDNGLHIAIKRKKVNPEMIDLLVEAGLNPEAKNRQHKSAAELAVDLGATPIVKRLARHIQSEAALKKGIKLASDRKNFGAKQVLKGRIVRVRKEN